MADPADHERWAGHNENFARSLKGKWPGWTAIAGFYAALHYVDAFLRGDGGWNPSREEEKHTVRNSLIRQNYPGLRAYLRLFQWGHDARYRPEITPPLPDRAFEALEQVKDEIERLRAEAKKWEGDDADA